MQEGEDIQDNGAGKVVQGRNGARELIVVQIPTAHDFSNTKRPVGGLVQLHEVAELVEGGRNGAGQV